MASDFLIGVTGAAGRMGAMLMREIIATEGCALVGATEAQGHAAIGRDAGTFAGVASLGIAVSDDAEKLFGLADAVLDFTIPTASTAHAAMAAKAGKILVIGTTGLEPADLSAINAAAKKCAIIQSPNMSVSVTLMMALTERIAGVLGDEYDIEIVEMHHRQKVDAPSGTALGLGRAAARGRGVNFDDVAVRARDGQTGPRKRGAIGHATLRGGDVVGDHTVMFAADGERFELTHKASSRQTYARGAVRAALWARDKPHGLYSMADVVGFK
ncbi:MAG: 4-hydroxy-tetrahydrodipicolinate reductase [Alphaproteobacteria bacterium]|nr:4-hydroxy-tetrahydrodipicolinate reductase [Alphaproteobacteria bacterium]